MVEFKNPFILPAEHYKRDINIMKHYVEDVAQYLHISTGKPLEECVSYVKHNLSKGQKFEFVDRPIRYLERGENGDRSENVGGLWQYLCTAIHHNRLIAPTFTTYIPGSDMESLLATYIENNIALRNKAKKEMFKAEAAKEQITYSIKNLEQTNRKLANNGISGAHVSPSTPLYNKTAHSTLTSNCRSTSGYGNANNEKFVIGNRHYYHHSVVLNNIVSIVNHTDYGLLQKAIEQFNLYLPNTEDVMNCIKYSSNLYWFEKNYMKTIEDLVNRLTPIQKAAFLYTGDMYHLMKHNEVLVRVFLDKLSSKVTGECENAMTVIRSAPEDYVNLAHQLCIEETAGIGKNYSSIDGTDKIKTLALTVININNVLNEYAILINALWTTRNLPASVSRFPESLRRIALVSDTDSTIFTVQKWVEWHNGEVGFKQKHMSTAAVVIFLASMSIVNVLAVMSANFGIEKKKLFRIAMKNEYKFDVFVPTSIGKHYYANISCQEGNVYEKHKLEVKGVHLKSSNAPKPIIDASDKMLSDIMKDTMSGDGVSLNKYLKMVADIERDILRSLSSGEVIYLRSGTIKDSESYSEDEELSPYARHLFWNEVFGPKYGNMPNPPYSTAKLPISTSNKSKTLAWLNKIEDRELAKRLENWLLRNGKHYISTLYIPIQMLDMHGMIKEMELVLDKRRVIKDCCISLYIILETLGIVISTDHVDRLISDDFIY